MLQIVEQTKEEKMAMYMKLPKKQIAEMLINCNDIITALTQEKNCSIPPVSNSLLLDKNNDIDTVGKCANCGVEFHIHKSNNC